MYKRNTPVQLTCEQENGELPTHEVDPSNMNEKFMEKLIVDTCMGILEIAGHQRAPGRGVSPLE